MSVLVQQDICGLQVPVHDIAPEKWSFKWFLSVSRLNQLDLPMHMLQAQNDFSRIEFHFIFIENSVLKKKDCNF